MDDAMSTCVDCGEKFHPAERAGAALNCCDACQSRRLESASVVADQSFTGWEPVKTRRAWYQRRELWLTAAVVVLAGIGVVIGPRAKRRFDRWAGAQAVKQAVEFMAKGDAEHAVLAARRAIDLNPMDAEANRIIAQGLEKSGAPVALQWRRRLDSIRPGDPENLLAWSKGALMQGYLETAAEVLGKVKPSDRDTAAYHDLAARLALARRDEAEAESHWKEAIRLAPKDENFRLKLAVLQRRYGAGDARGKALEALREMGTAENAGRTAQFALMTDALSRRDGTAAKQAAAAIASAPGATIMDRLAPLSVLKTLDDPDFSLALARLRETMLAKPEELYQLLLWMNGHDLALIVLDWARQLPPELIARVPVCVAVADARLRAMDWKAVLTSVAPGGWASFEFARLAYKSRALERTDDTGGSTEAWQKAVAAAEARPERLDALSRLAFDWRWEKRGLDVLWKMASSGPAPRRVLDTLWAKAVAEGNADQLCAVSKLRMNADPQNVEARSNVVRYSLLTRSKETGIHDLADALYREKPGNPEIVATYALSLYQRRRIREALAATSALPPEHLRRPEVARYHAILLTAVGRGSEAAEYFDLGEKGVILPAEQAILGRSRATASGEISGYHRQLQEAAASSSPGELPKLIAWMNAHRMVGIVSDWVPELPPETASRPEVRIAIAEAHAGSLEWARLRELVEAREWPGFDDLRSAYLARVMHSIPDENGRLTAWRTASAKAAEKGADGIERLARLAKSFGWEQESEDLLWRLAVEPRCPRWAAETLWQRSLQTGSAARLSSASTLLARLDPRHERTRASDIAAAILRRSNESAVWEFSRELHTAAPSDPILTLIHAIALHRQGRQPQADALVRPLPRVVLKEPRTALYYSVYLTLSRRTEEAAEFLGIAGATSLLMEEKTLLGRARESLDDDAK